MKKSLFTLGVAVAVLTGCTNEEVVNIPDYRAIGFSTFVNNNTRAVTVVETSTLKNFNVFGANANSTSGWTNLFVNIGVTGSSESGWTTAQNAYWVLNANHRFAAYSDGNALNQNVTYSAAEQKLTFPDYTVSNAKDLIAAIPAQIDGTSITDPTYDTPVSLTFEHMLSQVKFTFTTKDADTYTLKIDNIQIADAINKATGTYTYHASGNQIDWTTKTSTGTYEFDAIADIASTLATSNSTSCLVMPQGGTDKLHVTFDATLTDESNETVGVGSFTATLDYSGTASGTNENTWDPGFCYNYTAEIDGSMLHDPDEEDPDKTLQPIKFTVTDVDGWDPATDETLDDVTSTETTEP